MSEAIMSKSYRLTSRRWLIGAATSLLAMSAGVGVARAQTIAGPAMNPAQVFAEPSLLARLQEGQIDATLGYKSAVVSQHLPFIALPPEINVSDPAYQKDWYSRAKLTLTINGKEKTVHPTPLVYYAAVLKNAKHPKEAEAFVKFLTSPQGQALFAKYGYDVAKGPSI
jgi:molybdate/tungstate transport system substrate-binding protein